MRTFADSKANQKTNERATKATINHEKAALLAWWAAFVAAYPEYNRAIDMQYPDPELLSEIQAAAIEGNVRQRQVATNDELIAFAVAVYATRLGSKLVEQYRGYFTKVATQTVKKAQQLYPNASKGSATDLVDGIINNVNWSDRIWNNMDALQSDVRAIMKDALLTHKNPADVTREIAKRYNVADYQARRLLRTESARMMADETIRASKESGYGRLKWVANTAACRICAPMDGRVFTYYEADGMIPRHPNCLCSWVGTDDEK